MNNDKNVRGQSVSFLFTMILLFALGISALFTILFGAEIYENINKRAETNFSNSTAFAYIANKVRQHDSAGSIRVEDVQGISVLKIEETYGKTQYHTMIYCKDGMLKELFTAVDSGLTLEDGLDVMELEDLSLSELKNGSFLVEIEGASGEKSSAVLSPRSTQE